jgi:hypothetical protein
MNLAEALRSDEVRNFMRAEVASMVGGILEAQGDGGESSGSEAGTGPVEPERSPVDVLEARAAGDHVLAQRADRAARERLDQRVLEARAAEGRAPRRRHSQQALAVLEGLRERPKSSPAMRVVDAGEAPERLNDGSGRVLEAEFRAAPDGSGAWRRRARLRGLSPETIRAMGGAS